MNELTIILFVMVIALYVLSLVLKRRELSWAVVAFSVIGIAQVLVDETLVDYEPMFLIIPQIYVFLESCVHVFFNKESW